MAETSEIDLSVENLTKWRDNYRPHTVFSGKVALALLNRALELTAALAEDEAVIAAYRKEKIGNICHDDYSNVTHVEAARAGLAKYEERIRQACRREKAQALKTADAAVETPGEAETGLDLE